jgi:5-formyltetrahydrofolate cyclo-ligase
MSDRTVQAKSELRRALRAELAKAHPDELRAASARLAQHLHAFAPLGAARGLLAFAPTAHEPDITPVVTTHLARGAHVCVPSIDWSGGTMSPALVSDWNADLVTGRHSLREPRPDLPAGDLSRIDVILVPGIGFDRRGHRLGRGAGYYDRFLSRVPRSVTLVGVCFDRQITDQIPTDSHDLPVHWLASESGVIRCA